jgi:hypothetical protein
MGVSELATSTLPKWPITVQLADQERHRGSLFSSARTMKSAFTHRHIRSQISLFCVSLGLRRLVAGTQAPMRQWPRRRRLRGRQPAGGRPAGRTPWPAPVPLRPGAGWRRHRGDHLPRSQGLDTSGDDGLVSADAGDAQQRHAVGQRRGDAAAGDRPGSRAQPGRRRRSRGGDRARLRHRRRAARTGRILATPQLAACAGQLHGHWKEAGMVTRDQPRNDGWTVVLRRQPARIMNGRPQGPAARRSGGRASPHPPDG